MHPFRSLVPLTLAAALSTPIVSAQANDTCVESFYIGANGGSVGGAVYFDITATEPVTVSGLRTNIGGAAGASVSLDVYTKADTAAGSETNVAAWALAGASASTSAGADNATQFLFSAPLSFPTGTTGVALVLTGGAHRYSTGNGTNAVHTSADGVLTVTGISATNVPFAGTVFATRVWNGDLCYDAGPANCVTTVFGANNGGALGGAVYFDLTTTRPTTFTGLESSFGASAGTPVGVQVFVTSGAALANASNAGAWTQVAVDDGNTLAAAGVDTPTPVTFAQPFSLPAGTFGVAIVAIGASHEYTDGTGTNQVHTSLDGVLSIAGGGASNVLFTGTIFQPRVWNGSLCHAPEDNCVETLFAANNGGITNGAVFFDIVASEPLTISSLLTNVRATGALFRAEVWTKAGTFAGSETNVGAWSLATVDDGSAIAADDDEASLVTFASPLSLPAGRTGVALLLVGASHEYTNGTNVFRSADGVLRVEAGSASNSPFASVIQNRTWNGRLCYDGDFIGTDFCEPAVPNSTGRRGELSATGSTSVAANDVRLVARNLPNSSSGFFLTSQTNGLVPLAGGAQGTLCIAGPAIGRYVGPGQVKNSGSTGSFSLVINLNQHPTPTGLIAVLPGQTWNFQCWYRDANPAATSNFTNAHRVTFH